MKSLWNWFRVLISGKPHFYIGGESDPYLMRWYLIPQNPVINIFLHKFMREDDDRAFHDHPWNFISVMIRGGYREFTDDGMIVRKSPSIAARKATHRHRVELLSNENGGRIPCWTLIVTGSKIRTWGFHCGTRFVPWFDFVDMSDEGKVGKGCGD